MIEGLCCLQENPSEEDGAVVDKIMSSRVVKKEVSVLGAGFGSSGGDPITVAPGRVRSESVCSVFFSVCFSSAGLSRSAAGSGGVLCEIQKLVSLIFQLQLWQLLSLFVVTEPKRESFL